jgi:hypothetical protein
MKDLEFLTTIEDVKALAKLVLGNDPKITGLKFLDKCCVEVDQWQLPYPFIWRLRMEVEYNGKPFIEDFILNENFNGKITRHGPLKSKYETDLFKDDSDYRSFEVFMEHGLPVVKITWHFPDFPWEKSKNVYNYSSDPEHITEYEDKPVVFLNKDDIYRMIDSKSARKTTFVEPKLVNGLPFWTDRGNILCRLSPHISYDTQFWSPTSNEAELKDIAVGVEYPLYRLESDADISNDNLLSVKFDGTNFELIRPSQSNLIK